MRQTMPSDDETARAQQIAEQVAALLGEARREYENRVSARCQ
ncbi:hypothetical protein GCM10010331_74530 [Streptomyces xanthochromogenes]|nr:hypothetical protein [Streptomyces xanthochromogenes]GHB75787.1 hypothetical protein GCM10010331_74530 [Streptomyces xanthochromogenes]